MINISADVSRTVPEELGGRNYATPASDKLQTEIQSLHQDIAYLQQKRDTGMATDVQLNDLRRKKLVLHRKNLELKAVTATRMRQRKRRENERKVLKHNPDIAQKLKRRDVVGRPRLEEDQPELLKTISDIVTHGSATDDRRRSDLLYSIKTLDGLTDELNRRGFKV